MYHLWRTTGQLRQITLGGRSTGQQSIDAVTASHAIANPALITGYSAGNWTPGANDDNGKGSEPVWLFEVGDDTTVAVDAFTGTALGINTL